MISLIVPVHNEAANLEWHYGIITDFFETRKLKFEIIYVDDGSLDDSLTIIKNLLASHPNIVRFISFSRNFGKEAAVSAGIHHATGDAVIIIDADGQHPITLIDKFLEEWRSGAEIVIGLRKSNKGEGILKRYGSKLFYFAIRLINGKYSSTPGTTDFRLIDKRVVSEYNKLTERNRIARNLIDWLGYKRSVISFEANERHAGKATYSLKKLFKLAIDGIVTHSTRPLKFISLLGFIISTLSVTAALFLFIERYMLGDPLNLAVSGVAILALFLSFLIGVVLVCQGLLALYLERVYYETQNRPLYVIREQD